MEDFLFVDTSVQISKILGAKNLKTRILARLEQAKHSATSSYILMEFNRRMISDAVWLHGLIKEIDTLAQLLRRISQEGFGRQKQNTVQILAMLFEEHSTEMHLVDTPAFWRRLLRSLETFIDRKLHEQFLAGIDLTLPSLANLTECSIAYQLPTKRQTQDGRSEYVYHVTCRREEARCRLPQLLQEHSNELLTLEQISGKSGVNAELRKSLSTLSQIRKHKQGWNAAKGRKNCWRLSDIIIALEVPKQYTLLTTNARHFVPLCEALGKKCEVLSL